MRIKQPTKKNKYRQNKKEIYLKHPIARAIWNSLSRKGVNMSEQLESFILRHFSDQLTKEERIDSLKMQVYTLMKKKEQEQRAQDAYYETQILLLKDEIDKIKYEEDERLQASPQ